MNECVEMMPWGRPEVAEATITVGNISVTRESIKGKGHAETNAMNEIGYDMKDGDIVISDVKGKFPPETKGAPKETFPCPICSQCRHDIFELADKYGANSVTLPKVVNNTFRENITVEKDNFSKIEEEISKVLEDFNAGNINVNQRSDKAWEIIEKYKK